jgi:predicted nucleic acid-binding protein
MTEDREQISVFRLPSSVFRPPSSIFRLLSSVLTSFSLYTIIFIMRIYIDTSVINGLYAQDSEIKALTAQFFKNVRLLSYNLYGSEATIDEIEQTPQEPKKILLKNVIEEYQIELLSISEEARQLARNYVDAKIIPKKYFADALHIAIAASYNIPVLVSWNFEHMVKVKTKLEVIRINRQQGYPIIEISSPREV